MGRRFFVSRHLVHLDAFELDILARRLVQVALAFQRPIRAPALTLEQAIAWVRISSKVMVALPEGSMVRVEPSALGFSPHRGGTARQYHGGCCHNCQERSGNAALGAGVCSCWDRKDAASCRHSS